MQNTTLPIQFAPNSTPAPQRQTAAPSPDGAPFAQTLARQVQQRQQEQAQQARPPIKAGPQSAPSSAAPAPTRSQIKPPAESADAGAPSQTQTQAQASADAPAGTDASPSTTASSPTKADGQDSADGDSTTVDASAAAAAATAAPADASPMANLIAIVASFNQQAAAPAPAVAETAQAALGSATERLLGGKGDAAAGFGQKFDHAAKAGAKTIASEAATTAADKAGVASTTAATAEASDALPAAPAADSKTASFAAALQERSEAQPAMLDKAAERVALLSAREPAPAATAATLAAPVQQASLAITQAIAAPGNQLAARVGTPDWDNQLGQKIVFMAAGQDQSATLTLNPPDLGPMQVVLSVSNDQAQVTFSAAAPEVRQALEAAMPKLRDMMSESGITLGQANVNDGAAQRQAQGDERGQGGRGNGFGKHSGESAGASVETPLRRGRILGGAGAVDTFA